MSISFVSLQFDSAKNRILELLHHKWMCYTFKPPVQVENNRSHHTCKRDCRVQLPLTVSPKQEEASNVDRKPDATDNQQEVRVMDGLIVEEALQRLHKDGEAERDEEDCIHERA